MQVALAEAIALLGVSANYTKDDVIAAFRREAKKAHPDAGGTAELFARSGPRRPMSSSGAGTERGRGNNKSPYPHTTVPMTTSTSDATAIMV